MWADNKQAYNLCAEDLITAGNMYFRTHYHYNKEAAADKYAVPTRDGAQNPAGRPSMRVCPCHFQGQLAYKIPGNKISSYKKQDFQLQETRKAGLVCG